MSVGGTVTEVLTLPRKIYINTHETRTGESCAIYVERTPEAEQIKEGDVVWWQGSSAYWSPADKSREDFRIPRIGYSGVSRPTLKAEGTRVSALMEWFIG